MLLTLYASLTIQLIQLISTTAAEGYHAHNALHHQSSSGHSAITPTTAPTSATTCAAAVCMGAAPGDVELDAAWPPAAPDELDAAALLDGVGGGGASEEELERG